MQIHLVGFFYAPGTHSTAWRLPDAIDGADMGIEHYVRYAQTAERGKFDAIFFQDTLATQGGKTLVTSDPAGTHVTRLEPLTTLAALAMVTKHLGLISTATTTYNEPYHIARKFASLDHISGGRAGWNVVTSQAEIEADNFGRDQHMEHSQRYARAAEFFDVVCGLWDSWEEDAIIYEKDTGRYFDGSKVHVLNYKSDNFKVSGPLNVARPVQGRPVIAQAGSSDQGIDLAARTAELVFTAQNSLPEAQEFFRKMTATMAEYGRHKSELKIMPGMMPIIGRTESEARAKREMMEEWIPESRIIPTIQRLAGSLDISKFPLDGPLPDLPPVNTAKARQQILINLARTEGLTIRQLGKRFASNAGHNTVCGTPSYVADLMEEWVRTEGCDGFTVMLSHFPTPLDDFVELVVPILQKRGIFRTEYQGKTLRDNLGLKRPAFGDRPPKAKIPQ